MGNLSGPDIPEILCWKPDGCCGPDVCDITEEQFVCAVRSLLPEGEPWNNTRKYISSYTRDPASMIGCSNIECEQLIDGGPPPSKGSIQVGAATVGKNQMVFGGCCETAIPCEDEPMSPQLAVVDAFAATAYSAILALCAMLRELDPCTARETIRRWAARFGITHPDPCGPGWSDQMLALLICLFVRLKLQVWNQETLQRLAALFGVCVTIYEAGKFNCDYGPAQAWAGWTMARDVPACRPPTSGPLMRLVPTCQSLPLSLNIVVCQPACIDLPPDCNAPPRPSISPPLAQDELIEAFKYVFGLVLPPGNVIWCVYKCDVANCVQ